MNREEAQSLVATALRDVEAEVGSECVKTLLLHHIRELGKGSHRPDSNTAKILYAYDWILDPEKDVDIDNLLSEKLELALGTVRQILGQNRPGWNRNQPLRRDLSDLEDFEDA